VADWPVPVLELGSAEVAAHPVDHPGDRATGDTLLYLMYTSGSTGRPKGIAMHHGPQTDLMDWSERSYRDRPVALHYFPVTSDVGHFELFATWASGGTVVVASEEDRFDAAGIAALIRRHRVDRVLLPVVALDQLARHAEEHDPPDSLREVVTTGDRQTVTPAVRRLFDRLADASLDNHYGSTEVNVVTVERLVGPASAWPEHPAAGRPMGHARVYVLDEDLLPAPIGVVGHIFIGGAPLARGYLGRPGLTAAAFLPDPFSPTPGARMYRIGDLGRRTADGRLECLGRADFQVKVHGYRVEPGEIEAVLRDRPDVAEVVVVPADPSAADPRLVAYVVPSGAVAEPDLRAHVGRLLPAHMVPRHVVLLDELPLSANGKVDRKRLPVPEAGAVVAARPPTPTELAVIEVWKTVLGLDEVGVDDDFFGLGGHSLMVAQVVHRLREELGAELPLGALFGSPTVAALAAEVDAATRPAVPALTATAHTDRFPLSHAQRRLWFLDQLSPGSATYNNMLAFRIRGPLDVDALTAALTAITTRHAVLRSRFPDENGEPYQVVAEPGPVALRRIDLSGLPATGREDRLRAVVAEEQYRPFDLAAGPVARHVLITLAADDHVLGLFVHHIASDAGSFDIYRRDLGRFYADPGAAVDTAGLRYVDYAAWQRSLEDTDVFDHQLAYWRKALEDAPPALELATDHPRPADLVEIQRQGRTLGFELDAELTAGLGELARDANATLFMVGLALFGVLLTRHTLHHQDEVVVGVPVEGRDDPRLHDVMGLFINSLAIRLRSSPHTGFRELLHEVRGTVLDAFGNQDVPFEHLVEALQPRRDPSRNPIFQALFQLQYGEVGDEPLPGLRTEVHGGAEPPAKFDLTMTLVHIEGRVSGSVSYSAALFTPETVERMVARFRRLAEAVVRDPDRPVGELELVTEPEWDAVLRRWNDTARPVPDVTLPVLLDRQAELTPDAPALVFGERRWTYRELHAEANRLAHELIGRGVGPGDVVALMLRRGAHLVPALLAVLKAGAAYQPIDPDHPAGRIADLVADTAPVLLLTVAEHVASAPAGTPVLTLDSPEARVAVARHPDVAPTDDDRTARSHPTHAAYVLHTSGSTGRPKGVVVEHRAIVNRLLWMQHEYRLGSDDRVLHKTPLTFDVSIWELLWPLVAGATLVVGDPDVHRDPAALVAAITDHAITTVHFVPSVLRAFLREPAVTTCAGLRRVIASGEALTPELRDQFRGSLDARLHNLYGPTEAAVDVSHHDCADDADGEPVPIGRPIWNTRLYVLDEAMRPVTPGTAGELYIGGVPLARGYAGKPALTADRFPPDPFGDRPGARLYRTGDLVRHGRGGELEFLGRVDHQVKVRGVRVEPGEVEAALEEHPDVVAAAVTAVVDAHGEADLVAHVATGGRRVSGSDVLAFLRTRLPGHLVPSRCVVLDRLPLTGIGKVDRAALPAPRAVTGDRRPRTPL
ncbi:MAG: amino acid adenylation domain-containing protein, partial [Saccharothrix sp.]|nr:amino acid adenylation domain-containing protein [Saccharothrix sp.]